VQLPGQRDPDALIVDLTGLEVGDGVHISHVTLPEGVHPTITDRDFTIATVAAPAGLKSDDNAGEGEEEETAEGESED
jgi:large subunit ribosomal protein L25